MARKNRVFSHASVLTEQHTRQLIRRSPGTRFGTNTLQMAWDNISIHGVIAQHTDILVKNGTNFENIQDRNRDIQP